MNLKPQLIDMIRTVPEVAVRLWCGGKVFPHDAGVRIEYEGVMTQVSVEAYTAADEVSKILGIRWGGRMLRSVQDVLELRHAAEDAYLENLFHQTDVPKALFVPAGVTASGYYRAMIPSDLAYEGGKVISHWTSSVDLSKVMRYDILWVQLITSAVLIAIIKMAKTQGVKIVFDIDDRLDSIPAENQASAVYGEAGKQAELREMIKLADLVTVSTEPLGKYILENMGAKRVKVLPNQLTANVAPRRHPPNSAYTRILWAGSPTHKRDLAIVAPAIRNLLKKYNGKLRFTCFGERLPEALADCYNWIDLKDPVDFDQYHDAIATIAADFGIAPLEANPFNESKSAIKALEYASAGYPMLLSPVGEYPVICKAGFPAELVENDGWEAAIDRMIGMSREQRDDLGKRGMKWVLENRCIGTSKASQWADTITEVAAYPREEVEESRLKLVT